MKFRFLSMIAAVALVAACESTPANESDASGSGTTNTQSGPSVSDSSGGAMAKSLMDVAGSDRVFFDFDMYTLKSTGLVVADAWAGWLLANPNVMATIQGHADERGTREYNMALGERRANAVKDYLVSKGVSASRLKTVSYGKERPAVAESTAAAYALNRRAVVVTMGAGS